MAAWQFNKSYFLISHDKIVSVKFEGSICFQECEYECGFMTADLFGTR